ncbi:hypothetical protein FB107DRAFT_279715 [Schizophyllum commune]
MSLRRRINAKERDRRAAALLPSSGSSLGSGSSTAGQGTSAGSSTPSRHESSTAGDSPPPTPSTPTRQHIFSDRPDLRTPTRGALRTSVGTGFTPQSVNAQRVRQGRHASPVVAYRDAGRAVQDKAPRRALPSQIGFALGLDALDADENSEPEEETVDDGGEDGGDGAAAMADDEDGEERDAAKEMRREAYRAKRRATTQAWLTDVIPNLRKTYMRLMEETNNLRDPPKRDTPPPVQCTCGGKESRTLSVLVLRMTGELA